MNGIWMMFTDPELGVECISLLISADITTHGSNKELRFTYRDVDGSIFIANDKDYDIGAITEAIRTAIVFGKNYVKIDLEDYALDK